MATRKRDISLTLALCLSLTVHAWVVYWVTGEYVSEWARLLLPPLATATPIAVEAPVQAPPPPPVRSIDRMDQLGDDQSSGAALATSGGDQPQQARKSWQEQASLSLDPEGTGGKAPSQPQPPSPPVFAQDEPKPDAAPAPKFEVPGSTAPPPQPEQVKLSTRGDALADADIKPPEEPVDDPPELKPPPADAPPSKAPQEAVALAPKRTPARPEETQREPQEHSQQPQPAQQPRAASDPQLPGDPAPLAESESDAFSTQESVEFRRGKTVARLGRKHKLVAPRLEMAAYADLMQMRPPVTIVLRLYIDEIGNVTKADIVKSSGSINLDQPTKQAAYRWWFEPRRDTAGRSQGEVFEFVVGFS